MGTKKKKKKSKKQGKIKKVITTFLFMITICAVTYVISYCIFVTKNNNTTNGTLTNLNSKTNEITKNEKTTDNNTINNSKNNTVKNNNNNINTNKTNTNSNNTNTSNNSAKQSVTQNSTTNNQETSNTSKTNHQQNNINQEEFTKEKAIEYLQKNRSDYSQYQVTQSNGQYYFAANGKNVIAITLFDVETSPETGLKYYGYKLQNIELASQGGTGTIENGYIYQDGSVELE